MRVAIISDMHGNLGAFQAVLEDIDSQQVDQILCGGDVVNKGAFPAECLALLRDHNIPSVMGNTDLDVLERDEEIDQWINDRLSADDLNHMRAFPQEYRLSPPGSESHGDDLMLVHSTPRSPYDMLICEPHPNPATQVDALTTPTPKAEALEMLAGAQANLIVYGHIHFSSYREIAGQRVASVSAVGLPLDGDQRAAYGIAEWRGSEWNLTHRRVSYDVDKAITDYLASDMPTKERVASMLKAAQWVQFIR